MRIAEGASDAELLRAAGSDVDAFEAVYRRHVRRVAAFAAGRCHCAEDVADVVALTFVRLLDAAERYDPARAEPGAFVMGIAANVARDLHRRQFRHRALVSRLSGRALLDDGDTERIDAAIDAARDAGRVRDALVVVPPGEQAVLGLVADGRTPGEAAHELGITSGAAWTDPPVTGPPAPADPTTGPRRGARLMADSEEVEEELAVPRFEDRLWAELAALHGDAGRERTTRHRRLPFVVAAAAVLVVAVVAVVAGVLARPRPEVVVGTGPGTVPRPGTTIPSVPPSTALLPLVTVPSAEPYDLSRVVAALAVPSDGIVHTTDQDGESWYDPVTGARRGMRRGSDGRVQLDSGWPVAPTLDDPPDADLRRPNSAFHTCDPGTRMLLDEKGALHPCDPGAVPPQPTHRSRTVDHCRRLYAEQDVPVVADPGLGYIGLYIQSGHIVQDGRVLVDGRELVRIRNLAGNFVYLIDPVSALPVVEIRQLSSDGEPDVTRYERLPRTAENLALLSPTVPEGFTPAPPDAISRPTRGFLDDDSPGEWCTPAG